MYNLITILGPTASGKTALAAKLADRINGEIISADSRQVYRGMDIGTGKDIEDYVVGGNQIASHLVDIVDPGYEYNVFEFQRDFIKAFEFIRSRVHKAILCGGSGMYLDAVLRNYELRKVPENIVLRKKLAKYSQDDLVEALKLYGSLHNTTDVTNRERTIRAIEIADCKSVHEKTSEKLSGISSLNIGIEFDRPVIRKRITERLNERLNNGMIQEVERILKGGLKPKQLIFYGLEYKFVTQFVIGEITHLEMVEKLNIAIHQFAKRQMTWFRRMQKNGVKIHWIDGELSVDKKLSAILRLLPN